MDELMYDTTNPYIEYKDNSEYRTCIRSLFKIDVKTILNDLAQTYDIDSMDPVTLDELIYSGNIVMYIMDQLYNATKDNALFNELYLLSASKMISLDPALGQVILFSYNYLYLYHPCLCVFLNSPADFNDTCTYYIDLKKKLNEQ